MGYNSVADNMGLSSFI